MPVVAVMLTSPPVMVVVVAERLAEAPDADALKVIIPPSIGLTNWPTLLATAGHGQQASGLRAAHGRLGGTRYQREGGALALENADVEGAASVESALVGGRGTIRWAAADRTAAGEQCEGRRGPAGVAQPV